MAFGEQQT